MSKYTGNNSADREVAVGEYKAVPTVLADGERGELQLDTSGNIKATLATTIAGEDVPNDVLKVEQRYSNTHCTADTLVKTGAGHLHAIVVSQPAAAAPTAGVLTVYDNTSEAGTVLFQHYFPASAVPTPVAIPINGTFSVGCYLGFDGTLAGLTFNVIYR